MRFRGVIEGISLLDEVFYLSSKFNIRVIWLTYVLRFCYVFFAQCNHRFVIFESGYKHCIAPRGGYRRVFHYSMKSSICRLNLIFGWSGLHRYFCIDMYALRNAITDSWFSGQVIGIAKRLGGGSVRWLGVERRISPIDEVFYLSSKFNIRVIWVT